MRDRNSELNIAQDSCPGFSPRELKAIGSREMQNKLKAWLQAREPQQWTFRQTINADVVALRGRKE